MLGPFHGTLLSLQLLVARTEHYTRQAESATKEHPVSGWKVYLKTVGHFNFSLPPPPVLKFAVTPASREASCDQGEKGRKWHATATYPSRRPVMLSKWAHLAFYSPVRGGPYLTVDTKYCALPGVPSSYGFHIHVHTST
jgi:hypothetical protein